MVLKGLLSLFLQENCSLCERPNKELVCQFCQRQINQFQYENPCQFWQGTLPLFAWGIYEGKLKQAIAALKYENQPQLGELMGVWLGKTWLNSSLPISSKTLTVIPIPLHPQRQQERGFNQAQSIAQGFCQVTGYTLQSKGLERVRNTEAMFGLNVLEREKNMKNAFIIGNRFNQLRPKTPILLLDDIYTTGITATEAAKVLQSQGVKVLGVAAIATPRKR